MPTCHDVQPFVERFSLVHDCDQIQNGMLRLATPFRYPDGSFVDVFLGERADVLGNPFVLTDLGQTTASLLDVHVKPWTTKKRRQIVADICDTLGVRNENGQFEIQVDANHLESLPAAIVRLSQACIRVSDLVFTQRLRTLSIFRDDVEEFVTATDLQYEPDVLLPGIFGREIRVDFRVSGPRVVSLVQTLSTGNTGAAHGLVTEAFTKWYDLGNYRLDSQFVTVYDATNNVFRDDDLARLETVSTVIAFPAEEDRLRASLAA